jgi:hypothetical protein
MSAKRRVVLVTSEVLPGWGYPTAGGGIRAHSLGEALREAGHELIYSLPISVLEQVDGPKELREYAHQPEKVADTIHRIGADIAVFEQWQPLSFVDRLDCPVVVDLPGPLILEYSFRGGRALHVEAGSKIRALSRADLYLYSNPVQKAYWLGWTTLAGAPVDHDWLAHVPICRSPQLPEPPKNPPELRFIHGGVFWPWQDPTLPLNTLIDFMNERGEGRLEIFGGTHPHHRVKNEAYFDPGKAVKTSDRVRFQPMMPLEQLEEEYARGGIALELMARNPEREMASTIRTIGYLWCGLPIIINEYSYLAPLVRSYDAGWSTDPDDAAALRETFAAVYAERDDWSAKSKAAQALARDHFTWDRAARPLIEFCEHPEVRPKPPAFQEYTTEYLTKLENDLGRLEDSEKFLLERCERTERLLHEREFELQQIRSKFLFRIFKRLQRLLAPRD